MISQDLLDISPVRESITADLAAPFRARFGVPVIAVGGMEDPEAAADAIHAGRCDLLAIGRQMIADAQWPRKVREGRYTEIIHCEKCDTVCFANLQDPKSIECVNWPVGELGCYL